MKESGCGHRTSPDIFATNKSGFTALPGGNSILYPDLSINTLGTGVFWPSLNINTIGYLRSGKAYYVLLEEDVLIGFEDCE